MFKVGPGMRRSRKIVFVASMLQSVLPRSFLLLSRGWQVFDGNVFGILCVASFGIMLL